MTVTGHRVASGDGWYVNDVACVVEPEDRPFEEEHRNACIAVVTEGSFRYRSKDGAGVLVPGSLLLGSVGHCYECGHEHSHGDRCLSFHFTPKFLDAVTSAIPGVKRAAFSAAHMPPLTELTPLLAAAEAARDARDHDALEAIALSLAGAVTRMLSDEANHPHEAPSSRDEKRIVEALRRIEADTHEPLTLADLAREAAMSRYHFLRTFEQVVGMTPHQFILRTRLHRAAVRLRSSDESISGIAYDAGFNDLSTFNRRFRRVIGSTPGDYRAKRH